MDFKFDGEVLIVLIGTKNPVVLLPQILLFFFHAVLQHSVASSCILTPLIPLTVGWCHINLFLEDLPLAEDRSIHERINVGNELEMVLRRRWSCPLRPSVLEVPMSYEHWVYRTGISFICRRCAMFNFRWSRSSIFLCNPSATQAHPVCATKIYEEARPHPLYVVEIVVTDMRGTVLPRQYEPIPCLPELQDVGEQLTEDHQGTYLPEVDTHESTNAEHPRNLAVMRHYFSNEVPCKRKPRNIPLTVIGIGVVHDLIEDYLPILCTVVFSNASVELKVAQTSWNNRPFVSTRRFCGASMGVLRSGVLSRLARSPKPSRFLQHCSLTFNWRALKKDISNREPLPWIVVWKWCSPCKTEPIETQQMPHTSPTTQRAAPQTIHPSWWRPR